MLQHGGCFWFGFVWCFFFIEKYSQSQFRTFVSIVNKVVRKKMKTLTYIYLLGVRRETGIFFLDVFVDHTERG